jgi:hypothetical protein
MVVQTHTAEDCAFPSDDDRRATTSAFTRLLEISKDHGAPYRGRGSDAAQRDGPTVVRSGPTKS